MHVVVWINLFTVPGLISCCDTKLPTVFKPYMFERSIFLHYKENSILTFRYVISKLVLSLNFELAYKKFQTC